MIIIIAFFLLLFSAIFVTCALPYIFILIFILGFIFIHIKKYLGGAAAASVVIMTSILLIQVPQFFGSHIMMVLIEMGCPRSAKAQHFSSYLDALGLV